MACRSVERVTIFGTPWRALKGFAFQAIRSEAP
jgi:hypothetical protein